MILDILQFLYIKVCYKEYFKPNRMKRIIYKGIKHKLLAFYCFLRDITYHMRETAPNDEI